MPDTDLTKQIFTDLFPDKPRQSTTDSTMQTPSSSTSDNSSLTKQIFTDLFPATSKPEKKQEESLPEKIGEGVYGVGRGLVRGFRRGVSSVGGAVQALPESLTGKTLQDAGKSLEEFGEAGDVPAEQKGFWEKAAEPVGMMAPIMAAHLLAPEAAIPADVAYGSIFGLQQMHETQKAMKEKGIEPGVAPLLTGGATALAMFAAPAILGKFLSGPVASVVSKEAAEQAVGDLIKPTASSLIKEFLTNTLPMTEGIFLSQTGAVSGIEKAYGLPHDIPQELWETAKTAAGMSLMQVRWARLYEG